MEGVQEGSVEGIEEGLVEAVGHSAALAGEAPGGRPATDSGF